MSEFLAMGGYAAFVWPCHGLSAIVLWLNWYLPRRVHNQQLRQLKKRYQDRTE